MPAGRLARAEAVLSSMSAILLSRRVRTREAEVTLVRQKDGFRETARNSRDGTKLAISNSRRDFAFFPGSVTPKPRPTRVFGGKTVPDYFPPTVGIPIAVRFSEGGIFGRRFEFESFESIYSFALVSRTASKRVSLRPSSSSHVGEGGVVRVRVESTSPRRPAALTADFFAGGPCPPRAPPPSPPLSGGGAWPSQGSAAAAAEDVAATV